MVSAQMLPQGDLVRSGPQDRYVQQNNAVSSAQNRAETWSLLQPGPVEGSFTQEH